ncbi:GntR family transcriptional regulator [Nocardia aurantia]|uniref:Putative D-xylose utilization operon transcriptional repressor n=1 Tax=Nocardia aurantia TaxID=2585199 RepID=A0A7K0DUZ3_9NOCA|nr:GntR family transcriptional regulator [Nocardia aurantia]MQY29347.1 putative D-xylose utilization operon transcriptional repressor [Nocardia aurantia]
MADGELDLGPLPPATGRRMEQAITAVRAAIDTGRMRPGVKYSVYQLADALNMSRTPVREALLRLEEVGVIKFEARQGFRILLPQPHEIAEIFAVRLALEVPAARRAATAPTPDLPRALAAHRARMRSAARAGDESTFARADFDLHDLILAAAGNARSRAIVAALRETTRLLGASTADTTRTLTDIDDEHTPIVTAVSAGDPEAAAETMRTHLITTGRLLVHQAAHACSGVDPETIWTSLIE